MSAETTSKAETTENGEVVVTFKNASLVHLVCGLGLTVAFWLVHQVYAVNLVSDPSRTLFLLWVIECPFVILLFSLFRCNPQKCSFLKAVARGLSGLLAGALLNTFGAIVLGAPVGSQYMKRTINWSLLMSLFTFVPAASVFGSSGKDWQRLFAYTKPTGVLDYMICIPAHGAVIGAWLGAWPMPLDWERPWQEWPICVTYGALAGYVAGMVVSLGFTLVYGGKQQHVKRD